MRESFDETMVKVSYFFGAGHSNIPLSLAGSIVNFPSSTTSPRYLIFSFLNLHFLALKYRSYSHAFSNIVHSIFLRPSIILKNAGMLSI
jgi:hypothetical protein